MQSSILSLSVQDSSPRSGVSALPCITTTSCSKSQQRSQPRARQPSCQAEGMSEAPAQPVGPLPKVPRGFQPGWHDHRPAVLRDADVSVHQPLLFPAPSQSSPKGWAIVTGEAVLCCECQRRPRTQAEEADGLGGCAKWDRRNEARASDTCSTVPSGFTYEMQIQR